jgi:hypothetical protein
MPMSDSSSSGIVKSVPGIVPERRTFSVESLIPLLGRAAKALRPPEIGRQQTMVGGKWRFGTAAEVRR